MAGSLTYYKGKRGILRVTVRVTGLEPVVYRFQVSNFVRQEVDVPAGTDVALQLDDVSVGQAMIGAFNSTVEGVQIGFTVSTNNITTATPTINDIILRPFALCSEMGNLVWGTYPGVVIRNGTAYDARVTLIYGTQSFG